MQKGQLKPLQLGSFSFHDVPRHHWSTNSVRTSSVPLPVTSPSAPVVSSSTSTDRQGFSLDKSCGICTNPNVLVRRLTVTSPLELDPVETILLTEFHMPEGLSMWLIKEFGSVGHILVINKLSQWDSCLHSASQTTEVKQ